MTRHMRSAVLFIAIIFLSISSVFAQVQDAVRAFDEGNAYYRDGNYTDAIDAYQNAIEEGFASGALYYNLGNAYFRSDQLGQAIRYFEKAHQLMPKSQELAHNLAFARTQTVDQFSQLPTPWWVQWWRSNAVLPGGRWLLWIGLFFYVAGIAFIIFRMRTHAKNPWLRRFQSIAVIAAVLFLVAAFAASRQSERVGRAVVISKSTPLQSEPSSESVSELTIHEGLVVDVLQENESWSEISLPNGTRGWVMRNNLGDV